MLTGHTFFAACFIVCQTQTVHFRTNWSCQHLQLQSAKLIQIHQQKAQLTMMLVICTAVYLLVCFGSVQLWCFIFWSLG